VLLELIETAEVNQAESEKKARWITAGAFILFAALGFSSDWRRLRPLRLL
jgi:hypothetical protein